MAFERYAKPVTVQFPDTALRLEHTVLLDQLQRAIDWFARGYCEQGWQVEGTAAHTEGDDDTPAGLTVILKLEWSEKNPGGDHLMTEDRLISNFEALLNAFGGFMYATFGRQVDYNAVTHGLPLLQEKTIFHEVVRH